MPPTPETPAAAPQHRRGGTRRALTRSWREALIPLAAGDTPAVPLLRALTRRILHGWTIPRALIDDIEVAVSELTTNALIHTRGPVRVRLAHRAGVVRLGVADTSPHNPVLTDANDYAVHGRGVGIVAMLADQVRVEPHPAGRTTGKIVVAEFRVK